MLPKRFRQTSKLRNKYYYYLRRYHHRVLVELAAFLVNSAKSWKSFYCSKVFSLPETKRLLPLDQIPLFRETRNRRLETQEDACTWQLSLEIWQTRRAVCYTTLWGHNTKQSFSSSWMKQLGMSFLGQVHNTYVFWLFCAKTIRVAEQWWMYWWPSIVVIIGHTQSYTGSLPQKRIVAFQKRERTNTSKNFTFNPILVCNFRKSLF